jgi:hypothetical protein
MRDGGRKFGRKFQKGVSPCSDAMFSRGLGRGEYDLEQLGSALRACWDMIPKAFFDALYESMPSRVRACYKAKGWHTTY